MSGTPTWLAGSMWMTTSTTWCATSACPLCYFGNDERTQRHYYFLDAAMFLQVQHVQAACGKAYGNFIGVANSPKEAAPFMLLALRNSRTLRMLMFQQRLSLSLPLSFSRSLYQRRLSLSLSRSLLAVQVLCLQRGAHEHLHQCHRRKLRGAFARQ